jgi:hypothetical protein
MPDELFHEERIASRFSLDRLDRLRRELAPAPGCDERGQLRGVEAS